MCCFQKRRKGNSASTPSACDRRTDLQRLSHCTAKLSSLQSAREREKFHALASSPLPLRRIERRPRAFGVAARLARMRDQAPVLGPQGVVAPRPGVRSRRGALGLRIVALLQAQARELLPQARIARLDAKRALEGR